MYRNPTLPAIALPAICASNSVRPNCEGAKRTAKLRSSKLFVPCAAPQWKFDFVMRLSYIIGFHCGVEQWFESAPHYWEGPFTGRKQPECAILWFFVSRAYRGRSYFRIEGFKNEPLFARLKTTHINFVIKSYWWFTHFQNYTGLKQAYDRFLWTCLTALAVSQYQEYSQCIFKEIQLWSCLVEEYPQVVVASATSSHPVYQTRTTSGEKYHLILRTEQQKSYGLPTGTGSK